MCLYANPAIIAKQRLGKNFTAAKITQATIEELMSASISIRSVSYQRKIGHEFFHELFNLIVIEVYINITMD
jgi:hypothetical protein